MASRRQAASARPRRDVTSRSAAKTKTVKAKSAKSKLAKSNDWTPGARVILDAAVAMFATEGFDAVSISQIADKAGVSKANVFHHFESKEALYVAVMKGACTVHANFAEELHGLPLSSFEKLRRLIEFELRFQIDSYPHVKMTMRELLDGHARVKHLARNTMKRNLSAVTALVKQGIERGEFAAELDPTMGAMLVHSATMYFFVTRHIMGEFYETAHLSDPSVYAEQIFKTLLKSMGG